MTRPGNEPREPRAAREGAKLARARDQITAATIEHLAWIGIKQIEQHLAKEAQR